MKRPEPLITLHETIAVVILLFLVACLSCATRAKAEAECFREDFPRASESWPVCTCRDRMNETKGK